MRIRTTPAGSFLALTGGNLTGLLDMGSQKITSLAAGAVSGDAARYDELIAGLALKLALAGGTMSGNIAMGTKKLTGLGAGASAGDSVRYEQALLEALLTTRGDILFRGASVAERLAKGEAGQFLTQGALDPAWGAPGIGEGHITILPINYSSIGQGTWAFVVATTLMLNGAMVTFTMANLDNILYEVFLASGTYTLQVMYQETVGGGICDIDIDDTEVGSVDMYGSAANLFYQVTGIVISSAGLKTLRLRADGKNASSTGYRLDIICITLWRTA